MVGGVACDGLLILWYNWGYEQVSIREDSEPGHVNGSEIISLGPGKSSRRIVEERPTGEGSNLPSNQLSGRDHS